MDIQTPKVAQAISKSSGMNTDSTIKMLQMLAPLLMGTLGKQKREQNLDANGLDSFTSTLASDFLGHADTKVTEIYINAKSILEKRVLNKIPDIMEEKNSSSSK